MTDPLSYKPAYRRSLPHIQPPGATLFVTFRLAGSLPVSVLERWNEEAKARERLLASLPEGERAERRYLEDRRFFGRYDAELDSAAYGPVWLREPAVAAAVVAALHRGDGTRYDLLTFTVMPNHVHMVFAPLAGEDGEPHSLSRIMHGLKRRSAWDANTALGQSGAFWQREYYDHYARDGREVERIIDYVLNNPVKAGLAASAEEWPWSYCQPGAR